VTGKPQAEAQQALDAAKLPMNVASQKYDEQVPEGSVLSWTVGGQTLAPGAQIVKGTPVDVVISQGPMPRTIPKVTNQPFDAANAALTKLGLQVTRLDDQFDDKVPVGQVLSTDPKAGQKVPRGSNVNIVVSKGPDVVTVPPTVVGADLPTATTQLQTAGLTLGQVAGPAGGKVVAISPAGGAVVKRGTPVNVLLG
jgi:serine/threonine-protein kinase